MIEGKVKLEEKEYRAILDNSSSSLKMFAQDRKSYYKVYVLGEKPDPEDDSKASIVGRIIETLLFEKDKFDEKFFLSSTVSAPSGNMEKFVNALLKYSRNRSENESFEDIARKAHKESEYKWTFDKVIEKFNGSDAEIFFKESLEVQQKGLTVITLNDIRNAEKVVEELKTNELTAPIISLIYDAPDRYTVYVQFAVTDFEIDELPLKGLMDFVVIDHKEKTIQCYDLKCVWAVESFYREYYLYRLAYIQAYVYYEACLELKEQMSLEYYKVLYPKFIVCDSINYYKPLIYTLDMNDIQDAYNGFEYGGKYYKGVKEIIKDLNWAIENNEWRISRKNYENRGFVNIRS